MKKLGLYVDSIFYPLTIGIISFVGWITNFNIPSSIVISLLAFLPLFGKDGRGYLALILLVPTIVYSRLSFNNIDIALIIPAVTIIISIIIFLIIRHPKFHFGRAAITLIPLYAMFGISYLVQFVTNRPMHSESLAFLIGLFFILILYLIFVPILYKENVFSYFSQILLILATIISIQVVYYYGKIGFDNVGDMINLGWIQSSTMASSLLVISLPFAAFVFRKRQWWFIPTFIIMLIAIYQLRTVSGVICTILLIIPLIFMTFHHYKYYPYYVIASIAGFGIILTTLFFTNDNFFNVCVNSLRYLSSFFKGQIPAHRMGIELFLQEPLIGPSINVLGDIMEVEHGYIRLLDDTVVTTLVMGGSLGLVVYFFHLVNVYVLAFKKKNPYRFLFFIFLIATELIGLVDNTIYNLYFNFIYLFVIAAYESSTRDKEVIVEQSFFNGYLQKRRY